MRSSDPSKPGRGVWEGALVSGKGIFVGDVKSGHEFCWLKSHIFRRFGSLRFQWEKARGSAFFLPEAVRGY
jgi:hypothetical protein